MRMLSISFVVVCLAGITGAKAESLSSALAHAYENNPDIAAAFIAVRAAGEGIRAAEGGLLPSINASAGIGASWSNQSNQWSMVDDIGVQYSQTLFDNFQTDAAIKSAQAGYDAAILAAENTTQNVLLSAIQAYVNVLTNRRLVQIRQETIGFVEAQVQTARERMELGEALQLDVSQAEASLAQANASYQSALNSLRASEANYQRWVGRSPGALSGGYNFLALLPPSLEAAIDRATTSHPALLAAAAQFRAAQFDYQEAAAGFGPNLSLTGNVGIGGFTGPSVSPSASIGLRLSVPIYTPTQSPALERANLNQIQTELGGLATHAQILEAVRQGWSGMEAADAQILSATAAVAANRLALESMTSQYEQGLATTLDILNQRSALASAQEALSAAQSQHVLAAYSLIAATGSLNALTLGLPVQPRSAEGAIAVQANPPQTIDAWSELR
jgi:outer membrane protein